MVFFNGICAEIKIGADAGPELGFKRRGMRRHKEESE